MSIVRSSLRGVLLTAVTSVFAVSAGAQCEISGPATICPDSSVTLCAAGSGGWMWVDLEGNTLSTDQCITAVAPGLYRVYSYYLDFDAWFGPCSFDLAAASPDQCAGPPPPPPPPPPAPSLDTLACPRPASWWVRQCRREGRRDALLDAAAVSSVAQCIDERSGMIAWSDASGGMCRALRNGDIELHQRTVRQFVAVLANLCASKGGVTVKGARFGLGADTRVTLPSGTTTVGAWAASADAELTSLQSASRRDKNARAAHQRLFAEAWYISHGVGMNTSCPVPDSGDDEDNSVIAAMGSDAELTASLAPVAMPNPFHGSMRMSFVVSDAAGAEVEMSVFDVAGRHVATLARGRYDAGPHVVQWDGRGLDGARARTGMYFVRGRIGSADVTTSVMKVE
jgi:hypothetical protein